MAKRSLRLLGLDRSGPPPPETAAGRPLGLFSLPWAATGRPLFADAAAWVCLGLTLVTALRLVDWLGARTEHAFPFQPFARRPLDAAAA